MAECCPTCERAFSSYNDYPILYIASFERIPVPELIGSNFGSIFSERKSRRSLNKPLPKEVRKIFEKSGKDKILYEGIIYSKISETFHDGMTHYQSSKDVTVLVKDIISSPKIQETLSSLEGFVGKEVLKNDLLKLPGFNRDICYEPLGDISLHIYDTNTFKDDFRICHVCLDGCWSGGSISSAGLFQDLAEISYEGRVNLKVL